MAKDARTTERDAAEPTMHTPKSRAAKVTLEGREIVQISDAPIELSGEDQKKYEIINVLPADKVGDIVPETDQQRGDRQARQRASNVTRPKTQAEADEEAEALQVGIAEAKAREVEDSPASSTTGVKTGTRT